MNPLSRLRTLLIVTAALTASLCFGAKTYYVSLTGVDTNPGTIDLPLASLTQATLLCQPGDTVCVRGGVYKWTKQQTLFGKGTAALPVTVTCYPYEGVTVDGLSMPANVDSAVAAGSHLIVKYIQFNNGRKANLSFWNVNDIKVLNCGFGSAVQAGLLMGSSTLGGASGFTVDHCRFYNNCTRNRDLSGTSWQPAIQLYQAKDVTVTNNTVNQNWGEGIGVCATTDTRVLNNEVSDNFSVNIYLDNAVRTSVQNNWIYNVGDPRFFRSGRSASGINMANESVLNPIGTSDCNIINNVISNCYSSIWYSNFGLAGGIQRVRILNNTCWGDENAVIRIDADPNHAGNTLQNNVFYQAVGRFISMGDASVGFGLGRNCWYGGNPGNFAGVADLFTDPLLLVPGSTALADYAFQTLSLCPPLPCGADTTLVGRK